MILAAITNSFPLHNAFERRNFDEKYKWVDRSDMKSMIQRSQLTVELAGLQVCQFETWRINPEPVCLARENPLSDSKLRCSSARWQCRRQKGATAYKLENW